MLPAMGRFENGYDSPDIRRMSGAFAFLPEPLL
jgi:hypothetical protein